MKKEAGLWIDHKKSVIIIVTEAGEEIQQIDSKIRKHIRFSGNPRSKTHENPLDAAEDVRERHYFNELNRYYDRVIAYIHDADSILLMGPGEAKAELEERLKSKNHDTHVVGIEAADKMTENQIAAKVREYFLTV